MWVICSYSLHGYSGHFEGDLWYSTSVWWWSIPALVQLGGWLSQITLEILWLLDILWSESKSLEAHQEKIFQRILVTEEGMALFQSTRGFYFVLFQSASGILQHLGLLQTPWVPSDLLEQRPTGPQLGAVVVSFLHLDPVYVGHRIDYCLKQHIDVACYLQNQKSSANFCLHFSYREHKVK